MEIPKDEIHVSVSQTDKLILACLLGLLFLVLASPFAFRFTNGLTTWCGISTLRGDSPNRFGWILHMVLFIVIIRLLMK